MADGMALDTIELPNQKEWTYKLPVDAGKAMEGRLVCGWFASGPHRIRQWFEADVLQAISTPDGHWQYKIKYCMDDVVELAVFPHPKYCFKKDALEPTKRRKR
jgi:hypothetical protein